MHGQIRWNCPCTVQNHKNTYKKNLGFKFHFNSITLELSYQRSLAQSHHCQHQCNQPNEQAEVREPVQHSQISALPCLLCGCGIFLNGELKCLNGLHFLWFHFSIHIRIAQSTAKMERVFSRNAGRTGAWNSPVMLTQRLEFEFLALTAIRQRDNQGCNIFYCLSFFGTVVRDIDHDGIWLPRNWRLAYPSIYDLIVTGQ